MVQVQHWPDSRNNIDKKPGRSDWAFLLLLPTAFLQKQNFEENWAMIESNGFHFLK